MRGLMRWRKQVHTKDGEVVVATPHEATFKGKHNACKAKTLIVLYHRKNKLNHKTGLSITELTDATGVSYNYLGSRLAYWHRWGYILRHIKQGNTRPVYSYSIALRGSHFVEDRIPPDRRRDYIIDIRRDAVMS